MSTRREGFALIAVLAAIAIAEIAVLAVLLVCREANASARDSAALARARAASEAAIRTALAGWDESIMRAVPPLAHVPVPFASGSLPGGVQYSASAERLARGIWHITGEGTLTTAGTIIARARSAAITTAIPLNDFVADFHSALVAAGTTTLVNTAVIDAAQPGALPPSWNAAHCAPFLQPTIPVRPAVALGQSATLSAAGSLIGTPPVLHSAPRTDSSDFTRLGPIPWSELAAIADRIETGTLSLAPAGSGSSCDVTAAANWGAPDDPAHPCFDYFPLIYSPGSLEIATGAGQGILAVAGLLTLRPGTRFTGVILAHALDAAQSEITGSVRVESSTRVGGTIRYNECALQRALQRAPALRRLYRSGNRWWLPAFG